MIEKRYGNDNCVAMFMKTVYYLSGHGGRLHLGLGEAIKARGYKIEGRELYGEFKSLSFNDQVETIAMDLIDKFWSEESCVIANSFGAYLFLHAQIQLESYPGRVLLLSPVLGDFGHKKTMMFFIPPRARKIRGLIESREMKIWSMKIWSC